MELSLSGNALKTFTRSITSLARVGTELVIQASSSQMAFHTLNSSRSAYQSITFKPDFFDAFNVQSNDSNSSDPIQCSVLLKSVCSILRTPVSNVDRLSAVLPSADASKLQWTLQCLNGVKKTYWISCNVEPDIQHLSLDRRRFPSSFVVRPRDLTRLLSNFQTSLQEITIIATEPSAVPSDVAAEIGGKSVELRSYTDPTKDNSDSALHTQLWIDPAEEFVQYTHVGDPVDVTFGVKELKAFLSFCEGCEVDIHLFFEKAGEPILMAPRFGFDNGAGSDFDATLVLATMLTSQLTEGNNPDQPPTASVHQAQDIRGNDSQSERARSGTRPAVSEHPSDNTKIWSDLSGSAARSSDGNRGGQDQTEGNPNSSMHNGMNMPDMMNSSKAPPERDEVTDVHTISRVLRAVQHHMCPDHARGLDLNRTRQQRQPMETDHRVETQDRAVINGNLYSQHHPSNWVDAGDDEDDNDGEDEVYVQSTPQYYD